jgi:hypothetical protein
MLERIVQPMEPALDRLRLGARHGDDKSRLWDRPPDLDAGRASENLVDIRRERSPRHP